MQKRGFFLAHSPIEVHFAQNSKDFVVEEVPLYTASGAGDHLFVKVRKKGVSTWEMISDLSERLGVKVRDVGYAGLKDKQAMAIQTISLPAKYEQALAHFDHSNIKILETARHNNKLKMGHLKGNKFFIRLKKVRSSDALKLGEALKAIGEFGMPNFFGFQRFGRDGDNYKTARAFLDGDTKIRGKKMQTFLINALQSERFNAWLTKRLDISHLIGGFKPNEIAKELGLDTKTVQTLKEQTHPFKLLEGDLLCHYPHGKLFNAEDLTAESKRFSDKQISPTGLLSGYRSAHSSGYAFKIEEQYFEDIPASGDRRYAWVFPEVESGRFVEEEGHYELSFYLPKGSYATALIEELTHDELRAVREQEAQS